MRELVAGNLRHHGRRYTATIVAVAIAVAFVAAALVFGGSLNAGVKSRVAGRYDQAAVVVQSDGPDDSRNLRDAQKILDQVPTVAGTFVDQSGYYEGKMVGQENLWLHASLVPTPKLGTIPLSDGALPASPDQAVVSLELAERLGIGVGDSLALVQDNFVCDDTGCQESEGPQTEVKLDIVGIGEKEGGSLAYQVTDLWVTPEAMDKLSPGWTGWELLVAGESSKPSKSQQDALKTDVIDALDSAGMNGGFTETAYSVVDQELESINTSQWTMTLMLLLFPVIASIVALIVVGTTFQVVFRQRERELALLRTIGATGKQVRRLMLLESAVVGLIGSLIGVLIGWFGGALIALTADVVPSYLSALTSVGWRAFALLLLVGTLFTLFAGFRPAVRASRVPPIRALAGDTQGIQGVTRKRKIVALVSSVITVGLGILTWVLANGPEEGKEDAFPMVLLAAVATAAAVITFVAAILPIITRMFGSLGNRESFKLAAGNTARNPGRTAATGIAIFIGVTLISMFTLGAQSLRATSQAAMDGSAPIDMMVSGDSQGLSAKQISEMKALDGVDAVAVEGAWVNAKLLDTGATWTGYLLNSTGTEEVVRGAIPNLGSGQITMPWWGADSASAVEICAGDKCGTTEGVPAGALADAGLMLTTDATIKQLGLETTPVQVWLKLDNPDDYKAIITEIGLIAPDAAVDGFVAMRSAIDDIVNVLVMVVVALLAVSVLVALVGVTNTLSLSVTERVKENGLLRALGMTKRAMRSMLGWEAVLISGVGAVAGMIAGAYFGIVGFTSLPIGVENRIIQIPWAQWFLILVVAVGAALLASVIPGRTAARVSPTEALAAE
ncbi:FtsX-like permease family protein [Actinomycetaceae bacterium MB13-C1-2]|nr:FtsX-like permease family protein [Actinomycetaceae bacterium MB13-C1-2]